MTLFEPSKIENTQMQKFQEAFSQKTGEDLSDYQSFHQASLKHKNIFWSELFSFFDMIYEGSLETGDSQFLNYGWFPQVKLNFAENLLKNPQASLDFIHESGKSQLWDYKKILDETLKLEKHLEGFLDKEDVLACYMPNIPETVISMLATSSLGGVFTSTSCDFGAQGVLDRFTQSKPKVLVSVTHYQYNGKTFNLIPQLKEIVAKLPSVEKVILVDFLGGGESHQWTSWEDLRPAEGKLKFVRRPFKAPQYIMYSSGTTGKPKCIVHSQGGTLLQHVKELGLHTDLTQEKSLFYFTTCGWMMWNWLVSALSFGSRVVLYEGSPGFPSLGDFFSYVDKKKIAIFGTSPKFLQALAQRPEEIKGSFDSLETILSTGAPLLPEQFDFVYEKIKKEVRLSSISGGTDIIGCFMLGNPCLPVRRGEIQCLGLGMDVAAFNDQGEAVFDQEGELVCRQSFPSQPTHFLNDPDQKRYKAAYFEKYPETWTHGDYITITSEGCVIVYGRSDATLNPGGVRIGTAEIYRQTEKLSYLEDSICVGKERDGDIDVILFVKLKEGELMDEQVQEIKKIIKNNTTPRHVPREIHQVEGIPYTRSGKKMELAVTKLINGRKLDNLAAVSNPECLKSYIKRA